MIRHTVVFRLKHAAGAAAEAAFIKDALILEQRQTIDDLRRRLDEERADRRQAQQQLAAAQERIAALLTDQRPTAPARPGDRGGAGGEN